jgi:hypothetical protein
MKAQWKYVVYRDAAGEETIDLFGTGVLHAEYVVRARIPLGSLISAGYVTAQKECYGMSTSLELESRPRQDTALLAQT